MSTAKRRSRIWAVVPAAGMGRRMGSPKQSLPFGESTVTGTVARTLLSAGVEAVVVVTRSSLVDSLRLPDDPRVHTAINDRPDSEMIDSIRVGLEKLSSLSIVGVGSPATADGVAVVPGDMPAISVDACRRSVAAFVADPGRIVIAAHAGRRGHPIIFPLSMRAEIDRLDEGLHELPQQYPKLVHLVETDGPGVVDDVDTMDDYDTLRDRAPDVGAADQR